MGYRYTEREWCTNCDAVVTRITIACNGKVCPHCGKLFRSVAHSTRSQTGRWLRVRERWWHWLFPKRRWVTYEQDQLERQEEDDEI